LVVAGVALVAWTLGGGVPAAAVGAGEPAADGAHSFVAKVTVGAEQACSGVLVHPQWLLTLASCFASGGAPVVTGPPRESTTAVVGRTDLAGGNGVVTQVDRLVPHSERDVVLARLATPVTGVNPVAIAATAPTVGEVLTVAGYGRDSAEWLPARLRTARFTVQSVDGANVGMVGETPQNASTCKGDAGGPALRGSGQTVELVALNAASWQTSCLGVTETRVGATETRVDDIRAWILGNLPRVALGFEPEDARTHWQNSVDDLGGGAANVGGICCGLTGPELKTEERGSDAHGGHRALLYSGLDNSAEQSHAYLRAFDLSHVFVTPQTMLSYWIYPQGPTNGSPPGEGRNSACVAVDLVFTDPASGARSNLRDSGARDQHGIPAHPTHQCAQLELDTWNLVTVPLGAVADGKQISRLDVGYDQPANTGNFRGYIDDISIDGIIVRSQFATGVEPGEPQPNWQNSADDLDGQVSNVGGICCGLTGPELKAEDRGSDAHRGFRALLYSGLDRNATSSYAYLRGFDVPHVFVTPTTTLSYWVYPQGSEAADPTGSGRNSACVAVNLIFTDQQSGVRSALRASTATDQHGTSVHPTQQCGRLQLDAWNLVTVALGAIANGKQISRVSVGYDQPANTGNYRGYIDDIAITATMIPPTGTVTAVVPQTGADEPSPIIEDYTYPEAAQVLAQRGVKLHKGDGNILFVDCGADPNNPSADLILVQSTDLSLPGGPNFCFRAKGATGYLTMEIPRVYLVRGESSRTVSVKVETKDDPVVIEQETVTPLEWQPVGEGQSRGDATILELRYPLGS